MGHFRTGHHVAIETHHAVVAVAGIHNKDAETKFRKIAHIATKIHLTAVAASSIAADEHGSAVIKVAFEFRSGHTRDCGSRDRVDDVVAVRKAPTDDAAAYAERRKLVNLKRGRAAAICLCLCK